MSMMEWREGRKEGGSKGEGGKEGRKERKKKESCKGKKAALFNIVSSGHMLVFKANSNQKFRYSDTSPTFQVISNQTSFVANVSNISSITNQSITQCYSKKEIYVDKR
jgi:hypothetical protein